MDLKGEKNFIVSLFVALYVIAELILPINSAFSHNLYYDDIEYECCESYQDVESDHIGASMDEQNDIEEIDNDCWLSSAQKNEKQCCLTQTNKLNLENILSGLSQSYQILLFNDSLQQKNIINTCTTVGNTIAILRTVILLN